MASIEGVADMLERLLMVRAHGDDSTTVESTNNQARCTLPGTICKAEIPVAGTHANGRGGQGVERLSEHC